MASVNNLSIVIKGEFYNITVGQEVRLSPIGNAQGLGKQNDIAIVTDIEVDDHISNAGIHVERVGLPHLNWEDGQHLTMWIGDFVRTFSFHESGRMVVNRDYKFKKTNLKGMGCKIIAKLSKRDVFIEMEKDIGGGSCDGTGRQGHCIPIKREFLTPSKKKEEAKRRT